MRSRDRHRQAQPEEAAQTIILHLEREGFMAPTQQLKAGPGSGSMVRGTGTGSYQRASPSRKSSISMDFMR